jgi:hypothetical protein
MNSPALALVGCRVPADRTHGFELGNMALAFPDQGENTPGQWFKPVAGGL